MNTYTAVLVVFLAVSLLSCAIQSHRVDELIDEDEYNEETDDGEYEDYIDYDEDYDEDYEYIDETDIDEVIESEQSIDEIIVNAANSSTAMDFIEDENTVLVEYDILYDKEEWNNIENFGKLYGEQRRRLLRQKRKAIHNKRWPGAEVPYLISNIFDPEDIVETRKAMNEWMKHTCIRFRESRDSDVNRIIIQNGGACSSKVGMSGGDQGVNLAKKCRKKGVIMHELGHALGWHHEHTRPDRDEHIEVKLENIAPSLIKLNFQRYDWNAVKDYSVGYDYMSVMHYGERAFSTNGQKTIIAKQSQYQEKMGQRKGFSFNDVKLANLMYNCHGHCGDKKCPENGFIDKNCVCQCPGRPTKVCGTTDKDGSTGSVGGTTKPTQGPKVCKDYSRNCARYAAMGYCSGSHISFMKRRCKKTCKFCPRPTSRPLTTEAPRTTRRPAIITTRQPVVNRCENVHPQCSNWASKGFCNGRYAIYMKKSCKKSCNHCSESERSKDCVDGNYNCAAWAKRGECKNNPAYMLFYCRKSCNVCRKTQVEVIQGKGQGACDDKERFCSVWARRGECRRNPAYMIMNCKKSCNSCGQAASARCIDYQTNCVYWKNRGFCRAGRYISYMTTNCRASCNLCVKSALSPVNPDKITGRCKDKNNYCSSWARRGECSRNPTYMSKNCRASCRLCTRVNQGRQAAPATTHHLNTANRCYDIHRQCSQYVSMRYCYDYRYSAFMRLNCRKSCGFCR
ncbi:uncharacterized protein LOC141907149 [Tubulanus polymorphus]|uniref:uncharacterized protein LOC141907149 n=1 Tax=Tubulanus polymorphus TaxID=672921 RepID=UPI003DA230E5